MSNNIILGDGVFAIGTVDIGLTRGGGQLTIEREYREIEADGDYGPVKGRIRKIRSRATLTMNALEIIAENIPLLYPATKNTNEAGPPSTDTITAKVDIEDEDYNDTVTWTGRTTGGRAVVITLKNAINLSNIDWSLTDKEEIVPEVVFTATYTEEDRTTEPWEIEFADVV